MTRALKRTGGESATHLKPAGIYTGAKRRARQNARRTRPQPRRQSSRQPPAPGAFPEMAGSRSRRDGKVPDRQHISLQGSPDSRHMQPSICCRVLPTRRSPRAAPGFNPPKTTSFAAPPEPTSATIPTYEHRALAPAPLRPLKFISRNPGSN